MHRQVNGADRIRKASVKARTGLLWNQSSSSSNQGSLQTGKCRWKSAQAWCRPQRATRRASAGASTENSKPEGTSYELKVKIIYYEIQFNTKVPEPIYLVCIPDKGTCRAGTAACRWSCMQQVFQQRTPWWTSLHRHRSSIWRSSSSPCLPEPSAQTRYQPPRLIRTRREEETEVRCMVAMESHAAATQVNVSEETLQSGGSMKS